MNNISKFCVNNYNCQPLREKKNTDKTSFCGEVSSPQTVSIDDKNVQKFGARFYQACNELKGLFPYLTAKESAALIWDRMKTTHSTNNNLTELNYEI